VPYPKLSLANHCQRIKHPKYAFANQHGHIRRCICSLAGGLLFVQQKRPSAQPGANLGYCFSARIIVMPPTSPFYEIYRASGWVYSDGGDCRCRQNPSPKTQAAIWMREGGKSRLYLVFALAISLEWRGYLGRYMPWPQAAECNMIKTNLSRYNGQMLNVPSIKI